MAHARQQRERHGEHGERHLHVPRSRERRRDIYGPESGQQPDAERKRGLDGPRDDWTLKRVKESAGFTLPEVLFAAAIIGIGLVGLMVVVPVGSYGVQQGNQVSTAAFLLD